MIPIIHPRNWLTNYLNTYYSIFDLRRVLAQSEFPEIKLLRRFLLIDPTEEQIYTTLQRYRESKKPIAYDIEVTLRELSHISFAISADDAISIPFIKGGANYWSPEQEYNIMMEIASILEDKSILKINHNITFDASFMFQKYGIVTEPVEDIMVAFSILYPEYPKELAFIVSMYCNGEPYYKDDRKTWVSNPFGADEVFMRYSAMDSAVVCEVYDALINDLKKVGNYKTYLHQVSLIPSLIFMACYGINVDVDSLHQASIECDRKIRKLKEELNKLCRFQINYNSPQQVCNYFYVTKKQKPYTQDNKVTSNDRAMKQLAIKGFKEAEIILELRHLSKLKGTYFDTVVDPDGRLRSSYNPVGTKQGRISSSKTIFATGMNMQNQPDDTLKYMHPDPGFILFAIDLSMAENRWVAYYANETRMIEAFESGKDVHKLTGALRAHKPYEEVTDEERKRGKRMNHSFNYGLGPRSYSLDYQIPYNIAKEERDTYYSIYPRIPQWQASIRDELVRNNRVLVNYFGRRFKFRNRWNHKLFMAAYSYKPQSNVAYIMNEYGYKFIYTQQDLFHDVYLLNTVHDSVKFQIPLSAGAERMIDIILSIKNNLERTYELNGYTFTIPADISFGFSFHEDSMVEWKASYVDNNVDSLVEELDEFIKKSEGLVKRIS